MSDIKSFQKKDNESQMNFNEQKQFIIKNTNTPDIYILYDTKTNNEIGLMWVRVSKEAKTYNYN